MMLKQVQSHAPGDYAAFVESLSPGTRTALERELPLAWCPVGIDVEVSEAVARRFGMSEYTLFVAARQREELGSPLFSSFLKTVLRVWGATPTLIVKQLPTGWKQLFADCGTVTLAASKPGESRMLLSGLPPVCRPAKAWIVGIPAGLQALCDDLGIQATIEFDASDAPQGVVSFVFRWERR